MVRRWTGIGVLAVAGALGCSRDAPDADPPAPAAPAAERAAGERESTAEQLEPESPSAAGEQPSEPESTGEPLDMLGHFEAATEARDALVQLDGDSFRAAMSRLSAAPKGKSGETAELRAALASSAQQAVASDEPETWGQLLGQVGSQCAACHQQQGRGPELPAAPSPEQDQALSSHMRRHQWALDRLWEGLFVPDERAWSAGAQALQEAGEPPALTDLEGALRARVRVLDRALHGVAARAAKARTAEQRAAIFGQLIVRCGQCHAATGRGGRRP